MGLSLSKVTKVRALRHRGSQSLASATHTSSGPDTATLLLSGGNIPQSSATGDRNSNHGLDMDNDKTCIISKQRGSTVEKFEDEEANQYGSKLGVEKFGWRVASSEAVAMRLVQEHTDIPAPKLIETYFTKGFGQIVMTFIPGRTLESAWDDMSEQQKERLCRGLWKLIQKIRQVPRPPELAGPLVCLADGSPSDDPLIREFEDHDTPLTTDEEVRARIYDRYYYYGGRKYEKVLPDMLPRSSKSIFTHSDIAPRNIMVDEDFKITGLLDWERAGWYPDYWELANITAPACGGCGDWQEWMVRTAPEEFRCDLQGINAARAVLR